MFWIVRRRSSAIAASGCCVTRSANASARASTARDQAFAAGWLSAIASIAAASDHREPGRRSEVHPAPLGERAREQVDREQRDQRDEREPHQTDDQIVMMRVAELVRDHLPALAAA